MISYSFLAKKDCNLICDQVEIPEHSVLWSDIFEHVWVETALENCSVWIPPSAPFERWLPSSAQNSDQGSELSMIRGNFSLVAVWSEVILNVKTKWKVMCNRAWSSLLVVIGVICVLSTVVNTDVPSWRGLSPQVQHTQDSPIWKENTQGKVKQGNYCFTLYAKSRRLKISTIQTKSVYQPRESLIYPKLSKRRGKLKFFGSWSYLEVEVIS